MSSDIPQRVYRFRRESFPDGVAGETVNSEAHEADKGTEMLIVVVIALAVVMASVGYGALGGGAEAADPVREAEVCLQFLGLSVQPRENPDGPRQLYVTFAGGDAYVTFFRSQEQAKLFAKGDAEHHGSVLVQWSGAPSSDVRAGVARCFEEGPEPTILPVVPS